MVWLPPGYDDAPRPVLYMHDGHNVFDPATSYSGVTWRLDETIVELAEAGRIEAPIVVAPHTDHYRLEEYWMGPTGEAYLAWMAGALKSMIDDSYRTRPGREHTATIGSSMGGLSAFRALFHRPDVFSMAGCLSPAFATDLRLADAVAAGDWPLEPCTLYLDNGGDELDERLQPAIDDLLRALEACRFTDRGGVLDWLHDPGSPHHESAWSRRVARPLELFFGPS